MNYEMRLQEKWENGVKVGVAKGMTDGTFRTVTKLVKTMKGAGKNDKEIFDLAHEISDGEIPDEKLRSMIANS